MSTRGEKTLVPYWTATAATFLVVVIGNVLPNGMSRPTAGLFVIAILGIATMAALIQHRVKRYRQMDELQQRLELESLAAAFAGSFAVFVSYWLLQIAGLLPPMNGMYFVIGMVGLMNMGRTGALQRLIHARTSR